MSGWTKTRQATSREQSRPQGNKEEQARKADLIEDVMQIIDEHEDEYGLLQRGTIKRIVQQQKKVLPWLTENQIYSLRKRRHENKRHNALMAKEAEAFDSTNDDDDDDDSDSDFDFAQLELDDNNSNSDSDSNASRVAVLIPFKTTVGRPKGTTEKQKELNRKKYEELTDDVAVTWYKIQKSSKRNNTRLFELIILKKDEHELPDAIIPETTIRSRLERGNLSNVQRGRKSPMADVEPSLIMLLKYASRMGEYVSQRDCIKMANELISGSLVEKQLQEWKMNNIPYCKQRFAQDKSYIPKGEVGWGWFYAFHKRYSEISTKFICNVKHYRSTWSTYALLEDMYQIIYNLFLQWKLAIKLPAPQWQDEYGNEVPKEQAMGSQVEYKLLHPDMILTMDETGDNGNQADDAQTRQYKVVCEKGTSR